MPSRRKILTPKKVRNISAFELLEEVKKGSTKTNIKAVCFIPPKLGTKGYGSFNVTYKVPQLLAD